ncbi:apelin receptor early endogenous ligand [Hippoglossus hippoglossus]|uniref:apelin receptor early endogenous ligand n=1 Tax=Hippoglossus hippoglossus TaxID=8267 RepID=UPI00148BA3C7|nr:apelin receptor early endogenous ligand [Hippoglossus hippoglossus]
MRIFNLFYVLLLLAAAVASVSSARPGKHLQKRRYHRHHCPHRRCLPLHSRVPFP